MALAEVGRFNRIEAHILVGRLQSEGIAAVSFDGEMSLGEGSALLIPVRVMVDEGDLADAQAIVAQAQANRD